MRITDFIPPAGEKLNLAAALADNFVRELRAKGQRICPGRSFRDSLQGKAVAHDYAVRLSLIAFVTATAQGVIAGSAFEPALKFALAAGAICYGLGWLCGELARRVVEESVEAEFKPQQPPATAAPSPTPGR